MSKLTLHLQSIPGYVAGWPAQYIKVIDPPLSNPFPGLRVIGRTFLPDETTNDMIWHGAAGADAWFKAWLPFYRARPWAHAWEAPNEPQPMANAAFRAALDAFTVRLAELMAGAGLRLVGMNWGVGWPDVGHAPEFRASMAALALSPCMDSGLASGGHYLGLHEYAAPAMQDGGGYLTLRYRRTMAELRAAGIPVPPIVIGECGIDGGVIGQPAQGWQHYTDEAGYLAQLQWYDAELKRDAEVVTACIFTVCDWDWLSFNVTEPLARDLAAYIQADGAPPEPPEPPAPPEGSMRYYDRNGIEMSEAQFRAIYGQFRVESPAGSKYRLVELWDSGDPVGMDFQAYVRPEYPAGARLVILNGGKAYGSVKSPDMQEGAVWACYAPPDIGAYTVTIEAPEPADRFVGAGWICETGHRHIQKYAFQYRGGEPEPVTYKLTVYIIGQGIVEIDPLLDAYPAGMVVTLKAVASPGWRFVEWATDLASTTVNPVTSIMQRDKTVTATFEAEEPPPPDDDVAQLIAEARALLAQADAKLIAAEALL